MSTNQNKITLIAALILISCAFAFGTDMAVNNGYDPGAMRKDASNASSPVFPGAVTVNGAFTAAGGAEFNGVASAVKILGNPGQTAGDASTGGKYGLDIWNGGCGINVGGDINLSTRTDATIKQGFISSPHFTNSEEPLLLLGGYVDGVEASVWIGGGTARRNAAKDINFHTAANNTTLSGTFRAKFNSTGQLLIATTTAAVDANVKLKLNGGMEIASGGFAVIGSDTRQAGYDLTVASGAWIGGVTTGGVFRLATGTVSDPAYSFTNYPNSGMFIESPTTLRFSIGGAKKAGISGNTFQCIDISEINGISGRYYMMSRTPTGALPIYTFLADTLSGLGRYQHAEPSMVASGTEAMRWTATGTIGLVPLLVGTTTQALGYDLTVASGAYLANVVATGTLTIPLVAPADPQPGMLWFEP